MTMSAFSFLLALAIAGTHVSHSEESPTSEENTMKNIESKVNDLWQSLLHPVAFVAKDAELVYASCEMKPSTKLEEGKPQVTGKVLFKQAYPQGRLESIINLEGFPKTSNQSRAIHIHEFGDLSDGCDAAGGHFNPFKVNHPRHPGDFGNFLPKNSQIKTLKKNIQATMFGPNSFLSRSVVIHELKDDLGKGDNPASLLNGNAGKRLACCVIGISNKNLWEKTSQSLTSSKKKRNARGLANKQA
ncbi:Extracellular superoxide dismutase [Cu-Zn] [Acipenser ruthenus]|uniref:Superoxide dismutase [Cu-Zn] n=2 Tax=Acipenser TaxID=7901 RepID=A0A444U721_ACIRT|nr:extracellular superoxide dismutase [Cu-Zn]-like [Acipenser ruthenus]XP_033870136.2 extracellular superoxide dismutase [Cu-Zn]-like [Acipenser ruthenus]QRL06659.1 SOD3 [Acipenser baerii]RXM30869.1 Extracellular superoxide dismutase [Cu-Zn] [Acipenser ruthenus]